jgi:succinate dehydrogenase / fumarate reductase cytochrome b subunit
MSDIANVFGRQEFVVRRLHSLLGLMPVGAFLCIHLVTNFSILDGPKTFQERVDQIHNIGPITLFFVEWIFIFLPILFHGLIGAIIVLRGKRNMLVYPYRENIRYTIQRGTGVLALAFILWHVFHTRGWLPGEWWMEHVTRPLGGGTFNPADAAATAAAAIRASAIIEIAYVAGILASVYHFANGLWTMGITWGVWTSPNAQRWANVPCLAVGLALAVMGLGALLGFQMTPIR